MSKFHITTSLLALALSATMAAPAHADPSAWNYTIFGLHNATSGGLDDLSGSFVGEDTNGDSIIGRGELTLFTLAGYQLLPSTSRWGGVPSCDVDNFECTYWSYLETFSYRPLTGTFAANGAAHGFDGLDLVWGEHVAMSRIDYRWTADTQVMVVPAPLPVPEPGSFVLTGAGLLALGVVRRRGRRAAVPVPASA